LLGPADEFTGLRKSGAADHHDARLRGVLRRARIFVAIVVTALMTSLMAGPMTSRLLWQHQEVRVRGTAPALEG
jgi:hypothetical protein